MARPSSTAATTEAKLSSMRTSSAASLATSVPVRPIAMPMSACLSAGASLTPSPVIATISPSPRRTFASRSFLLGVDAREDDVALAQPATQLGIVHFGQLRTGDHVRLSPDQADPPRDRLAGAAAVAGDHDDADSRVPAAADRVRNLGTRRVDHADEAEELEVVLDRVGVVADIVR
jgi:hypothetical protein